MQNIRSFLAHLFPVKSEKVDESKLADFQEFSVWKDVCNRLLETPFPPQESRMDFSEKDIEIQSNVTFEKLSNWEIVCQEILDTKFPRICYQKCHDELRRRGKSEHEIFEMRRHAWYTAGWLNFPMMMWDWVSLDESDMHRAIELLYSKNQINQKQRVEFEQFIKHHA